LGTARPFAVITGASRGIGAAYARQLAAQGYDLLLVARDKGRLEQLTTDLRRTGAGVEHEIVDLAEPNAAHRLYALARQQGRTLDLLVHNAGFGLYGPFVDMPMSRILEMLRLHVNMTVESTRLFLSDMIQRRRGAIIAVSSIAGLFPVPYLAEYAASKAFLISFCVALAEEARPHGVTVQVCCPGTTETDFHATARFRSRYRLGSDSAERVAAVSLAALRSGRSCVTIGWKGTFLALLSRWAPQAWTARRAAKFLQPSIHVDSSPRS
jgi:short-subunit dehydrogenase